MTIFESFDQSQNRAQHRGIAAVPIPVQAPVGGWNTRDAFDDVPQEDALQMENWIPGLGSVAVRKGRTLHSRTVGTPATAKSLMVYERGSVLKLLAAMYVGAANELWDVTNETPVLLGTAFTSLIWDSAMFQNKLIMVNGYDTVSTFDGTTFADMDPALAGPTNPVGVHVYKNRVYYWDAQDTSLWYTDLHAYGGTCTEFDISEVSKYGGSIIRVETWTMDGGMGPDDYMVIFMSSGEVLVYQGTSPSSVADWSIVGSYYIGTIMSPRSVVKFGGDLFVITELDIINLGSLLQGQEALTKRSKISGAMEAITYLAGTFGFDAIIYPEKKLAIFNIPDSGGTTFSQYCLNMITGAWCKITGWDAMCWAKMGSSVYMGGYDGGIYKAFDGYVDEDVDSNENQINSILQTSWMSFGTPENKTFHAMKPILRSAIAIDFNMNFAVDFGIHSSLDFPVAVEASGTPWGSPWGSPWGAVVKADTDWQIIAGYGRWVSALIKMGTKNSLAWAASLWHIEQGEAL